MFWGLIMEPHKRYTQIVAKSFHVSMASLDVSTAGSYNGPVQVMMNYENRNYLLCTLQKGTTLQVPLDLNFQEGTKIAFTSNGSGHVHLTGYLVPEEDDFDDELEEEEDEDDPPQLVEKPSKRKAIDGLSQSQNSVKRSKQDVQEESSDDDDDDDDEDDYDDSDSEEFKDESLDGNDDLADGDMEDDEEGDDDEEEEEEEIKPPAKKNKQQKQQQQQTKKQEKQKLINGKDVKQEQKQQDKPEKKNKGEQKKRVIEGGVQVEDLKVGDGAPAKSGKFVSVYYIGRLKNGKKFDSCGKGDGFKFRLGKKEVIQGWDIGIAGMKVGGKRRITIPPALAYGAKGSPPVIPPNSQLVFEVELKNVH